MSQKRLWPLLASFLSFLLIFSSFATPVGAMGQGKIESSLPESKQLEATVSKDVYDAFKKQDFVEIIVEMKEQVDTSQVATESKLQMSQQVKPYEEKLATKYAVINKLKQTAERTQQSLLDELSDNKQVEDFKSFHIMNVVYVKTTKEMVEKIKKNPEVKRITLDRKIEVNWPKPTETDYKQSVSKLESILTENEDQTVEWNIDHIEAPQVWNEFGVDGSGVVVGIIDSGAHWNHEALMDKWRGYNRLDPKNPNPAGNWFDAVEGRSMPYDISQPHGTHVLGTILGQGPNGENKIGVAPGAKWIAARAFTVDGGQQSWLLAAGEFMLAPNGDPNLAPDIINNSWGGGPGLDEWYRPMVQAWRDTGILPVFAAGNEYPSKVAAPANYPESYAVAATDVNNRRGSFSNVGPGPYNGDLKPDISAPGVNIRSSVPNGYQGGWNGTSMATPHISGVAALLLSVDANLKVDRIEEKINQTATPLTDSQYPEAPNYGYGNGLVNAYDAVSSIATGAGGITGTILKEGIDEEEPEIIHEADLFGYKNLDFLLEAQVTDNISVVKTELLIRQNGESDWESFPFERTTGNFLNGSYQVKVPQSYVEVPGFQYKIRATDFSGNTTETNVNNVEVAFGIDPNEAFKHGFETELEGMLVTEDWQRGNPTVGPSPTEGENLVATNLTGNYSNQSNSVLQLPPLDLRNVTEASLSFKHWFDIEYTYDIGKVLVTDDINSQEWYVADTFTGRERTWNNFTIDLTEYANSENQVYVALLLESDHQTNHAGWYIDELSIDNTVEEGTKVTGDSIKIESSLLEQQSLPKESTISNSESGLPVEAYVTVLETGRTAKTSLQDGTYSILHSPTPDGETYTLRVESYGYYPEEVEFVLNEEETLEENFLLEEIPKGGIAVTVLDQNQSPLEGVSLEILEDSRIEPSETNDYGTSSFQNVLEGNYTLRITRDNYQSEIVEVNVVGGETTQVEVELERFPGTVIQYDDGTADNARAFVDAGLGYATKISPDQEAEIIGASVFLWGEDWPYPGGNEFSITIYDSDDEGNPGQRAFEPKIVEGTRGTWNYIDLSEYEFVTGQDYYVVVIQTKAFEQSPAIGVDESSPFQDRTYIFDNGKFDKLGSQYGNFMIRSHVQYVTSAPVLDNTSKKHYTNTDSFNVTGTVASDGVVTIYNNGEEIASDMTANKEFSFDIVLQEGKNSLTATVTTNELESEHSKPIVVVQDKTLPELLVENVPSITNEGILSLLGKAIDTNLEKVTINGKEIETLEDGSFNYKIGLAEGPNTIEIVAIDLAGNQQVTTVEVELDTVDPVITSVTPNKDVYVSPGDSLHIKLMSDTSNGDATVTLKDADSKTINKISMKETEAATYETEWVIPTDLASITLHFELKDEAGNLTSIQADGSIFVGEKDARIFGYTRFDTAVEVSKLGWEIADTVILARGDEYADTLAGIPLAHQLDAPVLLTHSNKLYGPTKEELERLETKKVIILGGEIAISSQVEQELLESGIEVDRIAGYSRIETAGLIAERLNLDTNKAVIVNAMDFPDALSVASFAAMENLPILLSYTNKLPKATAELLEESNITETIVVGGEVAVSEDVFTQLPNPERISGHNRYETNVELFNYFNPKSTKVYVATGRNFADALTGATLSAKNGTGILLTYEKVPEVVKQYIQKQDIKQLRIFGGPKAISDDVYDELKSLLDE